MNNNLFAARLAAQLADVIGDAPSDPDPEVDGYAEAQLRAKLAHDLEEVIQQALDQQQERALEILRLAYCEVCNRIEWAKIDADNNEGVRLMNMLEAFAREQGFSTLDEALAKAVIKGKNLTATVIQQADQIRSVWITYPSFGGRTSQEANGVYVDCCVWPDETIMWAIRSGSSVLGKDGQWIIEPRPSVRDAEFYAQYRFETLDAAVNFARSNTPSK